jgi:hypothetical protein
MYTIRIIYDLENINNINASNNWKTKGNNNPDNDTYPQIHSRLLPQVPSKPRIFFYGTPILSHLSPPSPCLYKPPSLPPLNSLSIHNFNPFPLLVSFSLEFLGVPNFSLLFLSFSGTGSSHARGNAGARSDGHEFATWVQVPSDR